MIQIKNERVPNNVRTITTAKVDKIEIASNEMTVSCTMHDCREAKTKSRLNDQNTVAEVNLKSKKNRNSQAND